MHRSAVRSVAGLAAIALGLALLAACGDSAPTDEVPVFHDLAEPWQAVPFAVDPGIIATAQVVCRGAGMIPPGTNLVLADARGGDWMMLVFAAGASEGECFVRRDEAGRLTMDGGGTAGGGPDPALGALDVMVFTNGSMSSGAAPGQPQSDRGYVIGRMGVAVASVDVELKDGDRVRATVSPLGWFAAWWPTAVEFRRAIGFDATGGPAGVSQ